MYLENSYGGFASNPHSDKSFCCYTIYDKEYDMFYSGVKTSKSSQSPIGKTYFTSSSVVDFRTRFQNHPELFEIYIEYFETISAAIAAEKKFHITHQVSKNKKFYNVCNAGGSSFGTGSVLCKDINGSIYRVSIQEYGSGNHSHCCKGRMMVRTPDGVESIFKKDFNPGIHVTQFKDYVLCKDINTGAKRRIPKQEFDLDDSLVGITKGELTVYDLENNQRMQIASHLFDPSRYRKKNSSPYTMKVKDLGGNYINIDVADYKRDLHTHPSSEYVNRIDLEDFRKKKVNREEFDKTPWRFAQLTAKHYYVVDGQKYRSWRYLSECFGVSEWLGIPSAEKIIGKVIIKENIILND